MPVTARPWRPHAKIAAPLAVLLAVTLGLSACYLPVRFDAEIEVSRAGYYSMIFDGYLTDVQLYRDMADDKITPAEAQRRMAVIKEDFTRDRSVTEFKEYKHGIFKVHWVNKGDLTRYGMVTFFQRNEAMLTLQYNKKKNIIVLSGASLSPSQQRQIVDDGLNVTGELRLITDAKVLRQNATEVRNVAGRPGTRMYIWRIANLYSSAPYLELRPG